MSTENGAPKCVHESFHEQAAATPDAVCIVDKNNDEFTYAQVQRRVILLADELQKLGAREHVVAIYLEPSPDFVVAMLAILTAGAAYVPLELAYPVTMLQRVLQDATPVAVVTHAAQRSNLPASSTAAILCLDDREHETKDQRSLSELLCLYNSWPAVSLDDLAFVVYSSGTTGAPKGIANPHRAPALSYNWRFGLVDYGEDDRVACNVFFVWEALRPVMRGGAVIPVPASVIFDGEELGEFLEEKRVTEMLFTPSLLENCFNTISESILRQRFAGLKTIFLNGEVVSIALRARCFQLLPHVRFVNLYSISECHEVGAVDLKDIDLTLSPKFCPIGEPCAVSPVYILDEEQKPLKDAGDAGELYVGGDMLAIGYLNLPELTNSRFVPNPFDGGRMYRTGDRARFLENGQLEILGRCDFMVKIRGYSIVLGAVEAALMEAVSLSSCVVVADGEEGEDKHLVAYLVRAPTDEADKRLQKWSIDKRSGSCSEVRRAVDGALPHYMVPSIFIEVETLPVSAVGAKLDRKALQAQSGDRRAMLRSLTFSSETHTTAVAGPVEPSSAATQRWKRLAKYLRVPSGAPLVDVQEAMATLWETVLDHEPGTLVPETDFHESGGHSLSAARLASLVNKVFGCQITAIQLFHGTTIGKASDMVMASWKEGSSKSDSETVDSGDTSESKDWSVIDVNEEEKILQSVLDASILPADIVPKVVGPAKTLGEAETILLTGSTGFLGVHVLIEVLKQNPSARVTCLIRSADKQAVRDNMEQYGLTVDLSRVDIVHGDLSQPLLGLDDAQWNELVMTVDAVVHCGAAVSLTAPYRVLEASNVGGTLNMIRLTSACKPGTPLVYVSSNGIFPTDKGAEEVFLENSDIACLPVRLGSADGYGLSKWAAERLVAEAHNRGVPTLTIRFGNLGWHSGTGIGNPLDYQGMILQGSRRMSLRPRVEKWKFELTPVDFAARSMVMLAQQSKHLENGEVFNCVQKNFIDANRVFEYVNGVDGASIPAVSFDQWKRTIEDLAASNDDPDLARLLAFIAGLPRGESSLSTMAYLDCSKFDDALAELDQSLSRLEASAVREYYETFAKANKVHPLVGLVNTAIRALPVDPAASGGPVGPLAGKVAVLTGGSSGIGRAIALSLVLSGCSVALGARRVSELEKTRELISAKCAGSGSHAKTIIVGTDVTDRHQVASLVDAAEVALGPVDILVNCAGCMYFTLMKNVIWDQWDAQVDVNAKGTMYGIGCVLPKMLERGRGHIVNITSDAGRKAFAGLGVYSGSKFFVEALSQALRAETASTGLRVTCIQPGNVATPLLSKSTDPDGLAAYGEPTGAKVLEPDDIGRAVVYALTQPEWCAVNEILVEPREEPA